MEDRKLHREHHTALQRKSYRKNKDYIDMCKTPCAKCGCAKHYVLQFHHINPATKKFDVGNVRYSRESVIEEIKKCVCLCSNCHDTYHYFYGKTPVYPEGSLKEFLNPNWSPIEMMM